MKKNDLSGFDIYRKGRDSNFSYLVEFFSLSKSFRILNLRLKFFLRKFYFFRFLQKINYRTKKYATKNTQLTIDGFPRSANTYSFVAFSILNNNINVAHHSHANSQIIFSVKEGIPTLLLIRNPIDAVISYYIYLDKEISLRILLKSWYDFYKPLVALKEKMVIGNFNDCINDFGKIINNINSFYGTEFSNKDFSQRLNEDIFNVISLSHKRRLKGIKKNRISIPNNDRDKLKNSLKIKIINDLNDELLKCQNVYKELTL